MALVKKSLQPALLNDTEKGASEDLQDKFYEVEEFTYVAHREKKDEETGEVIEINDDMICFSVKGYDNTYFWASTSLYDFFMDQIEAYEADPTKIPEVIYDEDRKAYKFNMEKLKKPVEIKYGGKVKLKSDPQKSCNTWAIRA